MRFVRVRRQLVSHPIEDLDAAVGAALDPLGPPPAGEVAITVGSRGIDRLPDLVRACGTWLRDHGAASFVVPSMGSHNGATAAGQREMIETLGVTESATGVPVRAGMDCVEVGRVATGPVTLDRRAYEAAGVLVLNRIKLHTSLPGPLQSGLAKMLTVGLGKLTAAETFHAAPTAAMPDTLRAMAETVLATGKIWAGLAVLEDGHDRVAELHALPAAEILDREPALLDRHRRYFPRLPLDDLSVLVVDAIGKNFSGTGMDPNVIGRRGLRDLPDFETPRIEAIAALDLSPESHGNATGVGLADVITRRLRDAIDDEKTRLNVATSREPARGVIPPVLPDEEAVFARLRDCCGNRRWLVIPNTLRLDTLWASVDLADELAARDDCEVVSARVEIAFEAGRHRLPF